MLLSGYALPAALLSLIGLVLFLYGKHAPSLILGLAGIALMAEPCFIFRPTPLWLTGAATLALAIGTQLTLKRLKPAA